MSGQTPIKDSVESSLKVSTTYWHDDAKDLRDCFQDEALTWH